MTPAVKIFLSHTYKDAFRVFFSFEAFKKYIFKVVFSKVVKRTILIFRVAKHSVQLILYLGKPKLYVLYRYSSSVVSDSTGSGSTAPCILQYASKLNSQLIQPVNSGEMSSTHKEKVHCLFFHNLYFTIYCKKPILFKIQ